MNLHDATLAEQNLLELQFDGPVPVYALDDLRRISQRPIPISTLSREALVRWLALARRNLKAAQRELLYARRTPRTSASHVRWRLTQCKAARAEWRALAEGYSARDKGRSKK